MTEPTWVQQPTMMSCGQTCLAMLTGVPVDEVIRAIPDNRGTIAKQLCAWLEARGWTTSGKCRKSSLFLPAIALCRVRWGGESRRAHWVLWSNGQWWDPLTPGEAMHQKRQNGRVLSYVEVVAPLRAP